MFEMKSGKDVITNRIAGLGAIATLLVMALLTFQLKYQVQDLKDQASALRGAMAEEKHNIEVLRAEWHMLNDPGRLEQLTRKHLVIGPTAPERIVTLTDLQDNQPDITIEPRSFHLARMPAPNFRPNARSDMSKPDVANFMHERSTLLRVSMHNFSGSIR